MLKFLFKISIVLLFSCFISACSTTSFSDLFSNYNQQMHGVKQAQQQGQYKQALALIPSRTTDNGSYNLSLLEKARLEFLAENYQQSKTDFSQAYQLIHQAEQAAKVEISRGVEKAASIISNDNAIRYDVPYYEQSMLHSYQALNYLAEKDLSAALVEIRRANLVQQQALKSNAKALYHQQKKMQEHGVSNDTLNQRYPSMKNTIGSVKNGFQNAFTFYLSAVLYEAEGQANDAYIDYKKALEIYPDNHYVQQAVWRLANDLHMVDDKIRFKSQFSSSITDRDINKNTGQLVVLIENGIVANKQQTSLSLPIYTSHNDMRFYSIALPSYKNILRDYPATQIRYGNKNYISDEIVRLQSLAAKDLQDELPGIVTRQIVRLVAKENIRRKMEHEGGELGNIFANLYNIASEKADTRSWSTLPDSIDIVSIRAQKGEHPITITVNGRQQTLNIAIKTNRVTLVRLSAIGANISYSVLPL